ncbi:hypothetical protein FFLO_04202 [Filobasidium floriforme]|uniref:DNA topoisomerase 2 n=1 Tax=Filobasidium floriforme TaxID=5210 RepID=A0A8K0NQ57_9TREE|nr:hypothetical protein FFLO_04202 [Filobasidium floriforme]
MSDSEESDFHMESDGTDFELPVKKTAAKAKTTKAAAEPKAKKAPATKAPAKPKAAPKPKKASKKDAAVESIDEASPDVSDPVESDNSMEDSDEDAPVKKTAKASGSSGPKKSASEMYQKLSQLEHILKRPDSYIGSVEHLQAQLWVFDRETKGMTQKNISYVPGFFKIFDEILVNAADNKINDPTMDTFKVNIDTENNVISVYNNGRGIPIEIHSKEKIWIPELIFGNLLTSSNYDDDQKKMTGGRNGYGAKLANIYSTEFIVETADKNTMKKYKQVFSDNMSKKGTPKITDNKKAEEYTRITFKPDLPRFGMDKIDADTEALLMKRVYDMAGTVKDCKVFLNDERLKVKGFKQYIEMYLSAATKKQEEESGGGAVTKPAIVYEVSKDGRWEVGFALSDGQAQQVSFANSISTIKGGTHVETVSGQLATALMEQIKKKNKAAPVKPHQIKSHMWIFVNALVENPAFDSQTKETLTLKPSGFGSKLSLSEDFVKKVAKTGIVEAVLSFAKFKTDQMMKKSDGVKTSRISGIVKLEDANNAGSRKGKDCTLILTEGDSAKALAVSGLSVVGRDNYGVFPLRGKLLNVREAASDQILKNVEIQHIKQIMGLKHKTEYTSVDGLRYGSLMIMTDQDHDGSHIKGLIINFLDHFYPSLLKIPNFLVEFITPIVKVWKGKQVHTFYTMPQYEEWKEANNNGKGWESKYYKGLGTSTAQDAKKYFSDLQKHKLPFMETQQGDRELIDLAFNKKKADDRKEWLRQFRPGTYLDHDIDRVPIKDFINKELILFSMADNIRSIPSMADGLKPGQRKVIFAAFKKNLVKEIKVAQLAGYVSEKTAYHHGEVSLTMTIVGLAQNYVGSNNINLLEPSGQFGTRNSGGKDAASARYIFTSIPRITRTIFHPHDDPILRYQIEDDMSIEPEYYLPTVPLVLIDGADGIGTGWSTYVPNYNPIDIVDNLRRMMNNEPLEAMTPWYRGFKGTIERTTDKSFKCNGILTKINSTTIEITELPIRVWTQSYKEMLEEWVVGTEKSPATLKDYKEYHTDTTVHFVITMSEAEMRKAEEEGLEKRFRMSSPINTSNMVCFDLNGKIRKYNTPEEILEDFYHKRLEYYGIRKQNLADELTRQFDRVSNQARFVQMIVDKSLVVSNKKKSSLEEELRALKFKAFPKTKKAREAGEDEPFLEEEDEGKAGDFDYLLGMAIWSLTREKIEKLIQERDQKEAELVTLLKLTPTDIWNNDLENFLIEWHNMLQGDIENSKRIKPKKGGVAGRKLGISAGSDSEEDYKPVKAKAAAKPRAPAKPKVAAKEQQNKIEDFFKEAEGAAKKRGREATGSSDDEPVRKKPVPKAKAPKYEEIDDASDDDYITPAAPNAKASSSKVKLDSDDEEDFTPRAVPAKVTKPAAKPKAAAKKAVPVSDDDESDIPVPKPKKAAPVKSKKRTLDTDDDEESDAAPPKARKVAPAKSKKKLDDSDDDDFDDS